MEIELEKGPTNGRAKIRSSLIYSDDSVIPKSKSSVPVGSDSQVAIKKDSVQTPVENLQNELIIAPPYDPAALAILYNKNSYHKRCCLVKAGIVVRLGFSLYDPADENKKPDDDYKRAKKLIETYQEDLHNFQLDYEIYGNGYLEIVRDGKGEVAEIYHIPAKDNRIRIKDKVRLLQELIGATNIYYVPYRGDKYKPDTENRHEYIHLKNYNPENRYYGTPDYTGAIAAMGLDESAKTFNINRFSNPIPETILALAEFDEDKNLETNIKTFFKGNFGDATKTGKKVLLLQIDELHGGSIKDKIMVERVEQEIKDASFRGLRTDNREEIISAHGLSPRLVGLESASRLGGGGEVREQLKLINELEFIPRKKQLARIVNNIFLGMGIKTWKIKFDNFEFANAIDDATFYPAMVAAGIITPEWAAQEQGYPPEAVPKVKPNEFSFPFGQNSQEVSKQDKFAALAKTLKQFRAILESMRED